MEIVPFNRSLEQELVALSRGVSMECLVCGEFVMRRGSALGCSECGSVLDGEASAGAVTDQQRLWGG